MKIDIHDEAGMELGAAADFYEREREGLGDDLLAEADRVVNAIAESPTTWPFVLGSKTVRRILFKRFPYAAYFIVRDGHALVVAFGHTSRKAGYWRRRLKP